MTEPFDPMCETLARDMESLDAAILEEGETRTPTGDERAQYVRESEGTYNPETGHFLCDGCYIRAGMPVAPGGWVCP